MADLEQLVLSISADTRQMQRALAKLTGDTQKAAADVDAAFGAAPPKIDNVAKSLNKTRFETANLAAQFQDIAVQLQGGQNPFTIALQQGTQINQVIGRSGASGAVGLLGAAFSSLLNPVSLATIGIIALGGYAIQYASKAIGAVGDLDDKLKAHAELIKSLKDAYGEAGKGIDVAVHETAAVLSTLLNLSTDALKKQFDSLARSVSGATTDIIAVTDSVGGSTVIEEAAGKYSKFKGAIDDFRASVNAGTPDVLAFRRALADIVASDADEATKKQAKQLYDLSENAAKAQLAIEGAAKAARNFSPAALDAAKQGEEFAKALKALGSTVTPDLSDREKVMKNYNDAMSKATDTAGRLLAAEQRDSQLSILASNDRKKAATDAAKEAESAAKRFQGALDSTARSTAKNNGAVAGLTDGIGAITRLETEYRLTEQAQQAFGKVTDETRAKIKAQADAAGAAADALARAKIAANTDFTLKTALLSPQDLQIAQQLRGIYGNDIPAALQSTEAAGIRAADTLRTIGQLGQDVTRGVFTDFASQIRNGATAMDALRTAGVNALGKIADKLVSMAADNLWSSAFGGSSGLGGFFGSLFKGAGPTGVVGAAGGMSVPTFGFAGGTNFAPGGLARVGEQGPEDVILPRGSQVIPNHKMSDGDSVSISLGGSTVVVQGDASEKTLALIGQALAQHDAALPPKVVAAVLDAKKRRVLA